jgi:hypothetical protein
MGDRDADLARRERPAQRARCIALDDEQVGRIERQQPFQCRPDQIRMDDRVGLTRTAKRRGGEAIQTMVAKFETRMLTGDEQNWRLAESGEGLGNRTELDGLGTRSYHERDAILAQLSP